MDELVENLRAKGMQINVEPFSTSVCSIAVVIDPEGNAVTFYKVNKGF